MKTGKEFYVTPRVRVYAAMLSQVLCGSDSEQTAAESTTEMEDEENW